MGKGNWVLAVDGGGTKTAAALASPDAEVIRLPDGPGCNPQDGPSWAPVLGRVIDTACGLSGGLAGAVLGLAGRGEVAAHDAAVDALIRARLGTDLPVETVHDGMLAHRGAFGGGEGVLLIAGTGSVAVARGPSGFARAGGWGDVIGDEGSAFWIGREALALAARAADGRMPQAAGFAGALRRGLGVPAGSFGLLDWLLGQGLGPRAAAAQAAQVVDALAAQGWPEAAAILDHAGEELALAARAAAARAGLGEEFPWVATGGAWACAPLHAAVVRRLGPPGAARLSVLAGGLAWAAELAGWAPGPDWTGRAEAGLRAEPVRSPAAG
ncbi:putative N-acetylglucosamine kinase [Rubellimicrobium thermophilum DSM 16684]|uniref:Putative N-acetylglucosamine kinase n=1 Tax=Rubellimicrobium thermophilum DSM 16684 TaxID=1123069 RepID=S9SF20_9RHOB|nr:BadF/BadG/BcrA/BcrD ATPase family protein [Rubellimicrobium thermophilum]EPX84884.1 putative N-acetylglucosamine kinase [Rubellimicrobium thermophilum DSM 16684]